MLAFRFCVVVSAGTIAILGYGANVAAREMLPQSELPSVGSFAALLPDEPSDSHVTSPVSLDSVSPLIEQGTMEIETEADALLFSDRETVFSQPDSIASQPSPTPQTPEEEPRPGSGATDSSSDRNSDPAPPSSHPRRERPIADVPQDSEETARTAAESADAPPVAFSSDLDAARPNAQSILEAFKDAIAENANATSTEISSFPSPAESPETPAGGALIVESPPSAAPQVFEALKKVMVRFEGIERAIAIEDPSAPERPIAAIAPESFDRETFVPFERILRRFQQANPLTEPASVLAAEQAIPVPSNLLNPRSLLETFKQVAAEPPTDEEPFEAIPSPRASAPTPQSVIEAFARTLQENLPEPSTTAVSRAARAPFERILGSFNRITLRSTTDR
ncbi:MAG: hypothetical protein SVX43_11445, partial [Cyanobacteriota bacterium]|nr:hypothetical protein [Cyanobacteriota bacterium]